MHGPLLLFQYSSQALNLASYLKAKHFPDCCAVCGRSHILKGTQGLMNTSVMSTTVSVEPHKNSFSYFLDIATYVNLKVLKDQ
jgi:hypothetical protein